MIDVSDALLNADLTTTFVVTRRKETVSSKGRSEVVPTVFEDLVGVVCAAGKNDLDRLPEGDRMDRHVSIVTPFRLRGASKVGADIFKPDLVTWQGVEYVVLAVEPYPEAGDGFVQAVCGSGEIVDEAP